MGRILEPGNAMTAISETGMDVMTNVILSQVTSAIMEIQKMLIHVMRFAEMVLTSLSGHVMTETLLTGMAVLDYAELKTDGLVQEALTPVQTHAQKSLEIAGELVLKNVMTEIQLMETVAQPPKRSKQDGHVLEEICITKNVIFVMKSVGMDLTFISMNVMTVISITMMDVTISVKLRMDGNVREVPQLLLTHAGD